MKKLTIYHNNRCSKSRQCLALMPGEDVEIVDYMKNPLSEKEIKSLLEKLAIPAIDLVRKNEAIWKENYKGKELDEASVIKAMSAYPKLIERPIVVKGNKAIVARPPEKVLDYL